MSSVGNLKMKNFKKKGMIQSPTEKVRKPTELKIQEKKKNQWIIKAF